VLTLALAAPARERSRERVLDDNELAGIIKTARQMNVPYGGIVEFLALTGQRREEVAHFLGRADAPRIDAGFLETPPVERRLLADVLDEPLELHPPDGGDEPGRDHRRELRAQFDVLADDVIVDEFWNP